jgi:DNA invertase Pin-like site-specific DNA recombinase
MVVTIFAGLAEFERELIRERTGTGRVAAMKRGVRFGRPSSLKADQAALARRLFEEGKSAKEVARTFGVHEAPIYRALVAGPKSQYPSCSNGGKP